MGNITAIIVVCSICGFLILMLIFLYKKMSSKSSKSKLDEEINRYKNLNSGNVVDYSSDTKTKKELNKEKKNEIKTNKVKDKTLKLQKKLNSKITIEKLEEFENHDENNIEDQDFYLQNQNDYQEEQVKNDLQDKNKNNSNLEEQAKKQKEKQDKDLEREKEFDKFMDEFSYSRLPNNKNIIKHIEDLPPKIKAIVLGNIFNKFDE